MQVNPSASHVRSLLQRPVAATQAVAPNAAKAPVDHVANLQADWGKSDSNYDLNTDGTVDGADLGLLISRLSKPKAEGPASPLDQLLADWGKSDSKLDLNADGTVDGSDLGMLLSGATPTEEPAAAPAEAPSALAQLQADWGKSDSEYDLNADGTVDGADLGLMLSGQAPAATEESAPAPTPTTEEVLAAWGSADQSADINADGVVDGADLGLALAGTEASEPAVPAAAETSREIPNRLAKAILEARDQDGDGRLTSRELGLSDNAFASLDTDKDGAITADDLQSAISRQLDSSLKANPSLDLAAFEKRWLSAIGGADSDATSATSSANKLADDLLSRLAAGGYRQAPPAALRSLIDGLNLSDEQSSQLLKRVGKAYPPGSRISATA
jgi:Ca2+-binding EF-hand superfamily protein